MRPFVRRLLTGLVLLVAAICPVLAAPLMLDPEASVASLGHLSMLRDPQGRLDAEQAVAAQGWKALPGAVNAGYTTDAIWVRLEVQRPATASAQWLLQLSHALLDNVRLYRRDAAGRWQLEQQSGEEIGRSHWAVDARNLQLPLRLDDAQPTALLLRLQTRNAMSTRISLATPETYAADARREYLFYGLGLGFGLLLLIFHTLFWQMTREPISGWYLLYVGNALLVEALTAGLPQQLLDLPARFSDGLLSVNMCIGVAIGMRFATMQLETAPRWPRVTSALNRVALLVSLSTAMLSLSGYNGQAMAIMQVSAMLGIATLVGLALWLLPRDEGQARSFLLIFGVYHAGIAVSFLRNLGYVPTTAWTANATALGTLLHMVLMSERLNRRYDAIRREKEAAQQHLVEVVGRHNDNLEREVRVRTADLRLEIEQRHRLEIELRAALDTERRAKQSQLDFVAMVSHEFRTPLAIINTTAQQIAKNLDAAREKTLARCANLRAAAQRMTVLVDEYLTSDRMDTGQAPFQPRECSRDELVELLDDLVADWPMGRIQLHETGLPTSLHCDPGLLQVALRNLLANADRHGPPDRPVELEAGVAADGGLRLAVTNPGEPIPADEVPRLFEKYFRGRLAQQSPGAGLGLYLVRRIAGLHGGLARLEAAGQQGRICVALMLPLRGAQPI